MILSAALILVGDFDIYTPGRCGLLPGVRRQVPGPRSRPCGGADLAAVATDVLRHFRLSEDYNLILGRLMEQAERWFEVALIRPMAVRK